ncbi:hypothetical protein DCAR_0623576 [Daucus carota subsp. sativus]|uniref:Uncharacterized protein n=1 Tax=Daucus carota subsp. sativus TaxID=79200 RepID=A0A161ZQY5_DAUCS|nr:hypothetical protein DCAR_0623576 [Daucus carota subsp. sativus]
MCNLNSCQSEVGRAIDLFQEKSYRKSAHTIESYNTVTISKTRPFSLAAL